MYNVLISGKTVTLMEPTFAVGWQVAEAEPGDNRWVLLIWQRLEGETLDSCIAKMPKGENGFTQSVNTGDSRMHDPREGATTRTTKVEITRHPGNFVTTRCIAEELEKVLDQMRFNREDNLP